MPRSWVERQVEGYAAQSQVARSTTDARAFVCGRVLRAGGLTATSNASFYDVIPVTNAWEYTDLNANGTTYGAKPVYPLILNCISPAGVSLATGARVVMLVSRSPAGSTAGKYLQLAGTHDCVVVGDGNAVIVQSGTGGTIVSGYIQGVADLGFAGCLSD